MTEEEGDKKRQGKTISGWSRWSTLDAQAENMTIIYRGLYRSPWGLGVSKPLFYPSHYLHFGFLPCKCI